MRRIIYIAIIAAVCGGLYSVARAASTPGAPVMSNYTATPPFLVQSAAPNIMLVLDMSGSMQFPAHIPDDWDHGGSYDHQVAQVPLLSGNYVGTKEYYGYFDTLTFYQYSSGKFVANGACTEAQWNDTSSWSSDKIPGNLLNWATMSRSDILRKVLIGGKSSTSSYTASTQTLVSEGGTWTYTDTTLRCKFSVSGGSDQTHTLKVENQSGYTSCPVDSSTTKNVQLDIPQANRVGVIQEMADGDQDGAWDTGAPRFGSMVFNGDDGNVGLILDGCDIKDASATPPALTGAADFISHLQAEKPYESTPTGEAMTNALDYFKHTRTSTQYGGSINDTYMATVKDPWQASCQKSFILLISDGEWGGGYPSALDPVRPARQGRIGSFDGTTHDLRSSTKSGNQAVGLSETQVVTTYTIYAFENASGGRNSLRQVAMYGGFTDKGTSGIDWPYPYTAYPTDSKTVTLPNSSCPALPTERPEPDYCTEWDEDQDGIPDNYYESQNGQEMHDMITAEVYDMMREASSGTSVSVLSTSAEGAGSLFQAYFDYKRVEGLRTVYWVGYLNALWIDQYGNIREDTDKDKALSVTDDYILLFSVDTDPSSPTYNQTVVNRYHDIKGNGVIDQSVTDHAVWVDKKLISGITPIWEAGKKLALRDDTSDPRTIYTFVDATNDGTVGSGEFGSDKFVNTTSAATTLQPYLNAASTAPATATNIIKFIRGQYVAGMRQRRLPVVDDSGTTQTDQFWKLGDITYSTPVAVAAPASNYHIIYGDTTYHDFYTYYKNRRVVIYTGANDGMLHAFNGGFYHEGDNSSTSSKTEHGWYSDPNGSDKLGRELWAYIPYNLLPHLRWLTATNYSHCYYVDLKPRIVDARIFPDNATHPGGWGTILIGGMRLGGGNLPLYAKFDGLTNSTRVFRSAYFALDITDPEQPPVLLWEYWDKADTNNSDLGFTTSYPTVVRVGGDYNQVGTWYLIFGSGAGTLGAGGTPYTWSISGTVKVNGGDGSTYTRYVYILDLKTGALVRKVDMAGVDTSISGKKVFMADPITVDLAVDYQVDKAYIGASYYDSGSSSWKGKMYRINTNESTTVSTWTFSTFMSLDKPVMAAPSASVDLYNRLWIYLGTGRYFNATDQSNTDSQYLVGAWDSGSNTITFPSPSNLNNVSNIHVYQNGYVYNDTTYVSLFATYLAARRAEYSATSKYGWYLTTTAGERSLDKPTAIGGVALFPTFIPTSNVCSYGGSSNLYAPYYETGTAYYSGAADFKPVLGTDPARTITIGSNTYKEILNKTSLGSGMPTNAVIHTGKEQGVVSLIQMGTGVIMQLTVNPVFTPKSQTLFWEERR
jgi:Tfp pilus tip-associated adhesin PilY1